MAAPDRPDGGQWNIGGTVGLAIEDWIGILPGVVNISTWLFTSSAMGGSSKMIRSGRGAIAMAVMTRFNCPPVRRHIKWDIIAV